MESFSRLRVILLVALLYPALMADALVRHYNFRVVMKNTTKLCSSKAILTVNGKFPGPTIYAREYDTVIVRVTNHINDNVTIHWHGVKQLGTCWADGPEYITQCPIQPGQNFIHNFKITGQRGTLLWHAHASWLRATLHGAIVILPKLGIPYPFPKPQKEKIIILAEWWKSDVETVVDEATQSGMPPNVSDAHTINGHPGPVPGCSSQGYILHIESGKTYLLRLINAALNDDLFFKIAGHNLTVVEVDASYTKPFQTDTIFISPGQTTNAILTATKGIGKYLISTSPFMDSPIGIDNSTSIATLRYKNTPDNHTTFSTSIPPQNATSLKSTFVDSLRSLNSKQYPANFPLTTDHSLFLTVGVGLNKCDTCVNGSKLVASFNNISFVMTTISLLQAYYYNIKGIYTLDFPANPANPFDYTGNPPVNMQTTEGTRLYRLEYNSTVQVVLQDTAMILPESHPTHLHGFNFFVVGTGLGNFDPTTDPRKFNLVDPVERNTVSVPNGGWTAIRFKADNPGIWFLHCHLEVHTTWGLKMAFLVENGKGPNETLPPPPSDLPTC